MKKWLTFTLLVTLPYTLLAKRPHVYDEATKACPAYNNMKHTTNSNGVHLEAGKSYRILSEKEGQRLVMVEGERVAQRWVDADCFEKRTPASKQEADASKQATASSSNHGLSSIVSGIKKKLLGDQTNSQKNLLAISWQNAFCQTHQYKKECRRMDRNDFAASHFVLHGLWPQPRNNQYCNVSKKEVGMDKNKQWYRLKDLELSPKTRERLSKLMPGYHSNLHKHEWVKHGSCYGKDPDGYYRDAMDLLTQINHSPLQKFFEKNMGKTVRLKEIREIVDRSFGQGAGKHVTMNCQKGLITELWFHLGGGESNDLATLLKKGDTPKSRCFKGVIDEVGY